MTHLRCIKIDATTFIRCKNAMQIAFKLAGHGSVPSVEQTINVRGIAIRKNQCQTKVHSASTDSSRIQPSELVYAIIGMHMEILSLFLFLPPQFTQLNQLKLQYEIALKRRLRGSWLESILIYPVEEQRTQGKDKNRTMGIPHDFPKNKRRLQTVQRQFSKSSANSNRLKNWGDAFVAIAAAVFEGALRMIETRQENKTQTEKVSAQFNTS